MNFSRFLKIQEHRKDVVGGFARLVCYRDDLYPPTRSNSHGRWIEWINQNNATKETVSAFLSTWRLYDQHFRKVISLDSFRKYKSSRNPAEKEFGRLNRLHRLED